MFADHYVRLIAGQSPAIDPGTAFDQHALACVLAIAREATRLGHSTLVEATGLAPNELLQILKVHFPDIPLDYFDLNVIDVKPDYDLEEELLRNLLLLNADRTIPVSAVFSRIVARRAMRDDHLWQDLGLFERAELTRLLNRHFPALAQGNTNNMRWKKYFYRKLCEAEGFALCTAPSCRECSDFHGCFGEENGESYLARWKNGVATAA